MGISLQTYRLRIGTFNKYNPKGNSKEPRRQTYNHILSNGHILFFELAYFSLASLSLLIYYQTLLPTSSPPKLPSLVSPSSSSVPSLIVSPSSPKDLELTQFLYPLTTSFLANLAWCTPPWTYPPWPSSMSRHRNFVAKMVNGNKKRRGFRLFIGTRVPAF